MSNAKGTRIMARHLNPQSESESSHTLRGALTISEIAETGAEAPPCHELDGNSTNSANEIDEGLKCNSTSTNCRHDLMATSETSDCDIAPPKRRKTENEEEHTDNTIVIVNASSTHVPPEDRVFAIDFLMSTILSYLGPRQLKICCQVSFRWNAYAVKLLHKRQSLKVVCNYKEEIHGEGFKVKVTSETQSKSEYLLEALTDQFNNSNTQFPTNFFCFHNGNLNDPSLQNFLTSHGAQIKRLRLDVYGLQRGKKPGLHALRHLLFEQGPNIEELRLDDIPTSSWQQQFNLTSQLTNQLSTTSSTRVLPNLKCIEFEEEIPKVIFDFITKAAVNLQQVFIRSNKNLHFFLEISDSQNKLHLLKHLWFSPSVDSMPVYSQLVNPDSGVNLKLKQIDFSFYQIEHRADMWPAVAQLLSEMLHCNCETIEKIRWQPIRFLQLDPVKIPALPKVKVLKIEKNHSIYRYGLRRDQGIFPKNLCLNTTFPNLKCVKLYISNVGRSKFLRDTRDPMNNYFNSDNFNSTHPLLSVTKFCINCCDSYPPQLLEDFPKIFPNVKNIVFGGIRDFCKVSKSLWAFVKAMDIELYFDAGFSDDGEECSLLLMDETIIDGTIAACSNTWFSLDAGFTGFSQVICNELKLSLNDPSDTDSSEMNSKWSQLARNPSILDLKDLKNLKIEFFDDTEGRRDDDEPYTLSVSELTGRCAFQCCPQLEVSVYVEAENVKNIAKLKELVSPLQPYVKFGPW